jgi:hypothetical protein
MSDKPKRRWFRFHLLTLADARGGGIGAELQAEDYSTQT